MPVSLVALAGALRVSAVLRQWRIAIGPEQEMSLVRRVDQGRCDRLQTLPSSRPKVSPLTAPGANARVTF